jgi:predicted Zn-dependent protease
MNKISKAIAISAAVGLAVSACVTSPLGRSQLQLFSEDAMADMGTAAFKNLKSESKGNPSAKDSRYVSCVANRVVAALPARQRENWEVRVFAEDDPNAFALPGRKIGVYEGMLEVARNQHQLATVIGHEVAHVLAQHGNERMSTSFAADAGLQIVGSLAGDPSSRQSQTAMAMLGLGAQVGLLLPFSRAQETEADILGLDLMANAGFEPSASIELWQNMEAQSKGRPPEFLSTHPGTDSRIRALQKRLPHAMQLQRDAAGRGISPNC